MILIETSFENEMRAYKLCGTVAKICRRVMLVSISKLANRTIGVKKSRVSGVHLVSFGSVVSTSKLGNCTMLLESIW